ncbi:hypothetical protein D3C87_1678720 [compost metagenome]
MRLASHEERVDCHAPPVGQLDRIQPGRRAHQFNDRAAFDTHAALGHQGGLFLIRFKFALREVRGGPPVRQQHGLVRRQWMRRHHAQRAAGHFIAMAVRAVQDRLAPTLVQAGQGGEFVAQPGGQNQPLALHLLPVRHRDFKAAD